jgi:hypothetical protein
MDVQLASVLDFMELADDIVFKRSMQDAIVAHLPDGFSTESVDLTIHSGRRLQSRRLISVVVEYSIMVSSEAESVSGALESLDLVTFTQTVKDKFKNRVAQLSPAEQVEHERELLAVDGVVVAGISVEVSLPSFQQESKSGGEAIENEGSDTSKDDDSDSSSGNKEIGTIKADDGLPIHWIAIGGGGLLLVLLACLYCRKCCCAPKEAKISEKSEGQDSEKADSAEIYDSQQEEDTGSLLLQPWNIVSGITEFFTGATESQTLSTPGGQLGMVKEDSVMQDGIRNQPVDDAANPNQEAEESGVLSMTFGFVSSLFDGPASPTDGKHPGSALAGQSRDALDDGTSSQDAGLLTGLTTGFSALFGSGTEEESTGTPSVAPSTPGSSKPTGLGLFTAPSLLAVEEGIGEENEEEGFFKGLTKGLSYLGFSSDDEGEGKKAITPKSPYAGQQSFLGIVEEGLGEASQDGNVGGNMLKGLSTTFREPSFRERTDESGRSDIFDYWDKSITI